MIPVRIQPYVSEIAGRFFPPVPVVHREQMPALHRTHKFDDRVRSVVLQPWIQRDHRRVEAPSADLLDLSSVDLQGISILVVLRVLPVPYVEISRMEEIISFRTYDIGYSFVVGPDRIDKCISDPVMPSGLYMENIISLLLRCRTAVQNIADLLISAAKCPYS